MKNAVYALPAGAQAQEDFEWALKEIAEAGGEGMIVEARLIDGLSDDAVRGLFDECARGGLPRARQGSSCGGERRGAGTRRAAPRGGRTHTAIDFFGANGREDVEARLALLSAPNAGPVRSGKPLVSGTGHVWVTRREVHVDQIGSAWLIRRFIDPKASFKFVPAKGYRPRPGELRFDMFEAELPTRGIAAHSKCCCSGAASTNPRWQPSQRSSMT